MDAVTVGAKHVAFFYFSQQFYLCHFWVLANIKQLFAADMVKIKRGGVRVIPTNATTFCHFYAINQRATHNLKSASSRYF